jgi:hypothetical protein
MIGERTTREAIGLVAWWFVLAAGAAALAMWLVDGLVGP